MISPIPLQPAQRKSTVPRIMNPNQPSSSTYDGFYQSHSTIDPLDEILSQLLFDTPDVLSSPTPTDAFATVPAPGPGPATFPDPLSHLTCHWVSCNHPPLICGAPIQPDSKYACRHYRLAHNVRGNDKTVVTCLWYACCAPPMQRGSIVRHILTVHLGLLRWRCEKCGRVFSRKGTTHACDVVEGA